MNIYLYIFIKQLSFWGLILLLYIIIKTDVINKKIQQTQQNKFFFNFHLFTHNILLNIL